MLSGFVIFLLLIWVYRLSTRIRDLEKAHNGFATKLKRLGRQVVSGGQLGRSEIQAEEKAPHEETDAPPVADRPVPEIETPPRILDTPDSSAEIIKRLATEKVLREQESKPEPIDSAATAKRPKDDVPKPTTSPPAESKPSISDRIIAKIKTIGPDDPNMGWEMALGTYWLPRIGIMVLAIAVVYLLNLAWQTFGAPPPEVRVAVAYAVSAGLLFGAWRLEKKYVDYARVLYGGGIASTYFVTFATYYVPFAKIFDSPVPTLIGLAVIVLAWGAVAQTRHSPTVAVLVTFLGHLTLCVATFSVDGAVPYAVTGIVLLSIGSAFFLLRNRWYYVAALGLVGSYANHFFVMARSDSGDTVAEFAVGMGVLTIYLLIFALAEFFAPERLRRERVPVWFRTGLVTLNTVAFFALGSLLVSAYTVTEGYRYLFPYTLALVLIGLALGYLRRRAADPLFNVYMTKGIVVASWGLAMQFDGNTLTTWLALEVVVLLVSARRSGLVVTRVLAFGVGIVALLHGTFMVSSMAVMSYDATGYLSEAVSAVVTVLGFWAAGYLYQRTDWESRSPRRLPFSEDALIELWHFDLVARPEGLAPDTPKRLKGLLFPYLYALSGTLLCIMYAMRLVNANDLAPLFVLVGLALAAAAVGLASPPSGMSAVVVVLTAFVASLHAMTQHGLLDSGAPGFAGMCVRYVVVVGAFFVSSEGTRRTFLLKDDTRRAVFPSLGRGAWPIYSRRFAYEGTPIVPHLSAVLGVVLWIAAAWVLIDDGERLIAVSAGALLLVVLARQLNALPFGEASVLLVLAALPIGIHEFTIDAPLPLAISSYACLVGTAVFCEGRYLGRPRGLALHQWWPAPYALYAVPLILIAVLFTHRLVQPNETIAIAGAAVACAVLTRFLHPRALAFCSVGLLVWAQFLWHDANADMTFAQFHLPVWICAAVAIAGERFYTQEKFRPSPQILTVALWCVTVHYIFRGQDEAWRAFFWALAGAGFLGYGFVTRSTVAAAGSVAAVVLAALYQAIYAFANDPETIPLLPLVLGFLAPIVMLVVYERAFQLAVAKLGLRAALRPTIPCIVAATVLAVALLERIPLLSEFFLTISWSVLAVALFALSLAFAEKIYRYAGLVVLLLASLHVVAVDTRELEALYKVGAWAGLGIVLLALGFGYVKAFAQQTGDQEGPAPEERSD